MEKLFINHELSLLAKEKGFDETCIAYFDIEAGNKLKMIPQGEEINSFRANGNKLMIAAPTVMQLLDWFREKHKLLIYVCPKYGSVNDGSRYRWYYAIHNLKTERGVIEIFDDYSQTLNEAIEEAFKSI